MTAGISEMENQGCARVLAGQPLRPQIVVAEPEQAQRLQEGLAVPSLRPEGCIRRGNTGDEVSGGGTQGSGTSRTPRPPSNQPWRLWSPPPPPAPSTPARPGCLTVQPLGPALSRGGVGRGPHEQGVLGVPGEGGVGPRRQLPPGEAPQRVAPGV